MEVKEVMCYNQGLNKFKSFNANIINERWMKSTGFAPAANVNEEPILAGGPPSLVPRETPKRSHRKKT